MRAKLIPTSLARVAPAFLLALAGFFLSPSAYAQATSWNAYRDFYLSPTVSGWGGSTYPSAFGSAWGYYMGNVNGSGFPASVGTYLTSGQIYKYTSHNPAGSSDGTAYGTTLWDATGGAGFARYRDTLSWGTSLGRYDNPWFAAAPAASNRIWMQAGWLGGGASEGIASILTWTAPTAGTYDFTGSFQVGEQANSGASIAIVDSTGGIPLARTAATMGSNQAFNFRKTLNQGDVVQFQVGTNYKTGAAVGLDVDVAMVEVTSWNAYSDFYFDSTSANNSVTSWAGAKAFYKTPGGSAWGYYAANANYFGGFPSQIGSYFGTSTLYSLANYRPIGGDSPIGDLADAWDGTGGTGFARYARTLDGSTVSVGRFETPWFGGAPGYPSGGGGLWMQAGWLNGSLGAGGEGLASVVTWTAPAAGTYQFQGAFVVANNGTSGGPNNLPQASIAIADSTGGTPMPRSVVAQGSTNPFSFSEVLNAGDVIQFQVGTAYQTGAAVSLNASVTRLQRNYSAFQDFWWSGRVVDNPLSAGGPAAWQNTGNATTQGRSPTTPTFPTAWGYGFVNCTGGNPSSSDFYPTSIVGDNPEGAYLRAAWQQFWSLEAGVTANYADVPLWMYESGGAQVGWYGRAWYNEVPGYDGTGAGRNGISQAANSNKKYLLMRPSLGAAGKDGLASVVRWTAPASGTYRFKGEFLPGGDGPGTMSVAILTYGNPDLQEGIDTILMNRQTVAHDGAWIPFDFTQPVVQGQTVTWVVGSDGESAGDLMGLQADVMPVPIPLTLSGVSVASKTYDGNNAASITGTPTLVGVLSGDTVSLSGLVATFESANVGIRGVTINASLSGANASSYTLVLPTGVTGMIDKATPTISSAPTASPITEGQPLSSSVLTGGAANVGGAFAWTTPSTIPGSSGNYPVTFTPTDGANYNTASSSASVTVNSAAPTGASFTSWRGSYPASAALLLNYAFGAASPSSTLSKLNLPTSDVVSDKLVLTYYVRQEATNPSLVVPQLSTDLASPDNWAPLAPSNIATINTITVDGVQVVKKTASVPVDSTSRKFLRLKIQE